MAFCVMKTRVDTQVVGLHIGIQKVSTVSSRGQVEVE